MRKSYLKLSLCFLWVSISLIQAEESENVFKLGVIQSTTGVAAEDGLGIYQGIQLAIDEINERNNLKIKLYFQEDESNPRNTVSIYNKLKLEGVDAVIGATWSFLTNSIIPLAASDKLVVMSSSLPPEATTLEHGEGYFFTNAISIKKHAETFRRYLRIERPKTLVLVHTTNAWGEAHRLEFSKVISESNVSLLKVISMAEHDANDWRTVVPSIKALNPEAIVLLLNRNDIELFTKRAYELNIHSRMFSSLHGMDAYRLTHNPLVYDSMCFPYPLEQLSNQNTFYSMYESRYHQKPRIASDSSYDAVYLLYNAFIESRNNNKPLQEVLLHSKYNGAVGLYKFSKETSFAAGHVDLICIKQNALKIVKSTYDTH